MAAEHLGAEACAPRVLSLLGADAALGLLQMHAMLWGQAGTGLAADQGAGRQVAGSGGAVQAPAARALGPGGARPG